MTKKAEVPEETQAETPEETATLLRMATAVPAPKNYTAMDTYRDMRKVFLGSDEGQRVLRVILSWGHMFKPSFRTAPIDPILMGINEGERNIALRLLSTISREPQERPTKANTNPKKDA